MVVTDVNYLPCPNCERPMVFIGEKGKLLCYSCGKEADEGSIAPLRAEEIETEPQATFLARLRAMRGGAQ